jgi:hypothetical protein
MKYCEDGEDTVDDEDSNSYKIKKYRSCQNCPFCCYEGFIKYSLFSNTYPTLTLAYQFLLKLSVTQFACERLFSTLKYIKNRLRIWWDLKKRHQLHSWL